MKIRLMIALLGVFLGLSARFLFPPAEDSKPTGGGAPARLETPPPDSTDSASSPPASNNDGDVAE